AGTIRTLDIPGTATGPRVNEFLKGSEGAYGILVEATMKVFRHLPENRQRFAVMYPSWDAAIEASREIVQGEFGLPAVYLSGIVLLAAVVYLALRRILVPSVRYISIASDWFPLILIFGIAFSGIMMRYVTKIDINAAKQLTMGLVTFRPTVPDGIGTVFYIHLFLVSVLLAYFPHSKLMHLAGVFLSPTRNLRSDTRAYRHINPWNHPVHLHTYAEYEDEFREKMVEAGLPVDKPLDASAEANADKE
ncbi:MAG: menaquinol oxidoreductase, partial [Desulfobacteraceae bacterium]